MIFIKDDISKDLSKQLKGVIYMRISNEEDSEKYGLASKYYEFALKHDKHFEKYRQSKNKKLRDIVNYYSSEEQQKRNFPWRFLTKGYELKELKKIFASDLSKIINYLKIKDFIYDNFYTLAKDELTQYYDKQNIEKKEDVLIKEVSDFKFDRSFKRKVFNKETLELYRLYKEVEPIIKELYEKFKELQEKQYYKNTIDTEKDITDD